MIFKNVKANHQFKTTITINEKTMKDINGIENVNNSIYFDKILQIYIKIDDFSKYSKRIDILNNCKFSDKMKDLRED